MICFKKNKKYFKIYTNNLKDEIEEKIVGDLLVKNYVLHLKDEFDSKRFINLFVKKEIKNDFYNYCIIDVCGQIIMNLEIPVFLMSELKREAEIKIDEKE